MSSDAIRVQVYKLFTCDEDFEAVRLYYGTKVMIAFACDKLYWAKENFIDMTNKIFAAENKEFRVACRRVGIKPTAMQAARCKSRKGLSWKEGR